MIDNPVEYIKICMLNMNLDPDRLKKINMNIFLSNLNATNISMSPDFIVDLFMFCKYFNIINENDILKEISYLEGVIRNSNTKKESQFKYEPLKGLWKKHIMGNIFANICSELGVLDFITKQKTNCILAKKYNNMIDEICKKNDGKEITDEIIVQLVNIMTTIPLANRSKNNKFTGHWIIYKKNNDNTNTYVSISNHQSTDEQIYNQIKNRLIYL